jgi:hypothetical protein
VFFAGKGKGRLWFLHRATQQACFSLVRINSPGLARMLHFGSAWPILAPAGNTALRTRLRTWRKHPNGLGSNRILTMFVSTILANRSFHAVAGQ